MKNYFTTSFLVFLSIIGGSHAGNILFFLGVSTYSHRVTIWPLVEKLVNEGHNVTFFSGFPPKNPNPKVIEIVPQELTDFFTKTWETGSNLIDRRLAGNIENFWYEWPDYGVFVAEVIFKSPELVRWVHESHFDLVVVDALFNDVGIGLAHKFKAPHIIFCSTSIYPWMFDTMGIPAETSSIPDIQIGYEQQMSLQERIGNTLRPLFWYFHRLFVYLPKLDKILIEGLNMPEMPTLAEIEQDVSLVLLNSHFSIEYSRSLPSIFVPVAGMHIDSQKLSTSLMKPDMKNFIDQSGDAGFVYISFGSAVQISRMANEFQQIFFRAIGNSKTRFLWKWEGEVPPEMPPNVFTSKWMPQQEILRHLKIRGFITHGGMGGIQEAVYNAVPLVVIPIFDEQDFNAERVHKEGYGIRLHIETLTSQELETAIKNILVDNRFATKMKQISMAFKDRQISPLDTAFWWTEYVLRHRDTPLLRPIGMKQSWFKRRLLDVWGILLLAILIILLLSISMLMCILKKLFSTTINE